MSERYSLAGIECNAEAHFQLVMHAAVFRLIRYLRLLAEDTGDAPDAYLESHPFLADYFDAFRSLLPDELDWDETVAWWQANLACWEEAAPARCALPLRRLARDAGLSPDDRVALLLIGLVEDDIRFGALYAALQDPLPSRRMGHGLLGAILGADESEIVARLLDSGLIRTENLAAPRADWILRVPLPIWDALHGRHPAGGIGSARCCPPSEFPPLKSLILEPQLREKLLRLPALLSRGTIGTVVLRGMEESGRRTVLGSVARCLRRPLLTWDRPSGTESPDEGLALLGALSLLTGAMPALFLQPPPGETLAMERLVGYNGPVGITIPREGSVSGGLVERAIMLTLTSPTWEERVRFWRRLAPANTDCELLASRFRLPLGAVARVARAAAAYAAIEGRAALLPEDVQNASRALDRQSLDLLAQRLNTEELRPAPTAPKAVEVPAGRPNTHAEQTAVAADRGRRHWARLIVNAVTEAELLDLERRCRYREQLNPHLGAAFPRTVNPGVRALFHGPSGTGKTLAARALAGVLQMDLYRVDLSAIVNKYIGETEKNLSRLLSRAEELDVLLLIDEGDSLLSGRTDVRSANDRYANLETNYLLQRLESYEGIVFVTTNAGSRLDQAFERRFDSVIGFSLPGPQERLRLWEQHLPAREAVRGAFIREIAALCVLTGGQIRNAALHAALLAAANRSERAIIADEAAGGLMEAADVRAAIRREYRKAGAACPLPDTERSTAFDPIAAFLREAGR